MFVMRRSRKPICSEPARINTSPRRGPPICCRRSRTSRESYFLAANRFGRRNEKLRPPQAGSKHARTHGSSRVRWDGGSLSSLSTDAWVLLADMIMEWASSPSHVSEPQRARKVSRLALLRMSALC
ncbi:hypothetical protein MRX96_036124 [Rhipicephalus microplus]